MNKKRKRVGGGTIKLWNVLLSNYPQSEKVNSVSIGAEMFYTRLIAASDDRGNYYGNPALILGYLLAHRMVKGEANIDIITGWIAELSDPKVGLLAEYGQNGSRYLHLQGVYKFLRCDRSRDYRFPPEPKTLIPVCNGSVYGAVDDVVPDLVHNPDAVGQDRIGIGLGQDKDKSRDGASATPKSRGGLSNPEVKALMDWFYQRWSAANSGQKFPFATAPYAKEYKAAERLLKAYPEYESRLTGLLDGALAGHYFASPPDCIANFKPTRYTEANRKQGAPSPAEFVPKTEQRKSVVDLMRERGEVA
jgi:hypothetical protein